MEVFTQFSSELDQSTKNLLDKGNCLVELLKQPLSKPLALHEQVILLCIANEGIMQSIPLKEIKVYRREVMAYISANYPDIITEISTKSINR